MKLIDYIKYEKDNCMDILKQIKASERPFFIFGGSTAAHLRKVWLEEYGITIHGFCVDRKYFREGALLDGLQIFCIEDVLQSYEKVDLFIGFESAQRARQVRKQYSTKNVNVFWIEDPFRFKAFKFDAYLRHVEEYQSAFEMLEDQLSRDIYVAALNSRIIGCSDEIAKYKSKSEYSYDWELLELNNEECFVDCGAYDGDTIAEITGLKRDWGGCIWAFEPDDKNADRIMNRFSDKMELNVIRKALGAEEETARFYADGSLYSNLVESEIWGTETRRDLYGNKDDCIDIPITTLDKALNNVPVTLIKMDIEGSELNALKGAKKLIDTCFPKLAICIYHKGEDFYTLLKEIHKHDTKSRYYKYYIRHHSDDMSETVLYCIPFCNGKRC